MKTLNAAESGGDRTPEIMHLVLSTAALGVLSLALPVMTLQVYDRILPNPDSGTLPVLAAGVSIAVAVEVALRLARAWMIGWNGAVYEHASASRAMRHILSSDVARAEAQGAGEFLNRLSSVAKMKDFHNGYAAVTVTELCFVPLFLGVIFYIAPQLAAVPAALLLLFTGVAWHQGRTLRGCLELRDKADDTRYDFLISCLKGIHGAKAFALEKMLARRYESLQARSAAASYDAAEGSTAAFNAGTTLSHVMMAVLMTVGAVLAVNGHVTAGALIATLQLSGRLMQPVQRGILLWTKYQDYRVAQEKVSAIFETPARVVPLAREFPLPTGTLSARGLRLGDLLQDVSLDVSAGETVSIGGASGAGKTTLLEILSGLYAPDGGEALVDGLDIRQYPPDELARHIGHISTEGVVFRGTIRDNITRFGQIPEARAQEVAALLGVDADVARLPSGFDTVLASDGSDQVPPGLKQRISMTRVLAARPRVILFDEADRALDIAGYNLVFGMLAKLGRKAAMVLVTDDENLRALAQRHYMLKDGRLSEIREERQERKVVRW